MSEDRIPFPRPEGEQVEVKPTPGPMFPQDNGREPPFVSDPHGEELPRTFANMAFIADAFTVHHETGLTPRELSEQRAELLEALEGLLAKVECGTALHCDLCNQARAAITKAKGGAA